MKLAVFTPLATLAQCDDVVHLRAEDETGAFGILPGHADFLTALTISVVSWRDAAGAEHHAAVRGGMLQVSGGEAITIATREAVADDDLSRLKPKVLAAFAERRDEEARARLDANRLYLAAIRQICRLAGIDRSAAAGAWGARSNERGRGS
jgi:F-type H+-transporting ATPase subunit epsilon